MTSTSSIVGPVSSRHFLRLKGTITPESPWTTNAPDSDGRLMQIGGQYYIPSSGIRGKFRRAEADLVGQQLSQPWTLNSMLYNRSGGIFSGAKSDDGEEGKKAVDPYRIRRLREVNPLASLFGSMRAGLSSRLTVQHAFFPAKTRADRVNHVRGNDFGRNPDLLLLLSPTEQANYRDMIGAGMGKTQMKGMMKALKDKRDKTEADLEEMKRLTDLLKNEDPNLMQPLSHLVIAGGTPATHQMILRDVNLVEIGLFLRGLEGFGFDPQLGGQTRHYGLVILDYVIEARINGRFCPVGKVATRTVDGVLEWGNGIEVISDDPLILSALKAWDDIMEAGFPGLNFNDPNSITNADLGIG